MYEDYMKQMFLSFILLFSSALYGMRLDEKTLSPKSIKELAAGYSTGYIPEHANFVFAVTTPAGIKHRCRIKADYYDYACDNWTDDLDKRPDLNCGIASKMHRHLQCWWLYKQALSAAIHQK